MERLDLFLAPKLRDCHFTDKWTFESMDGQPFERRPLLECDSVSRLLA